MEDGLLKKIAANKLIEYWKKCKSIYFFEKSVNKSMITIVWLMSLVMTVECYYSNL